MQIRFRKIIFIVYLSLIFGAFQNCAPMHSSTFDISGNSLNGVSLDEAAFKFSGTLQPVVRESCGACHGVIQSPQFAAADARSAVELIVQFRLVNLTDPENSRLVRKILEGHNSFTPALATQVQNGIQAWADSMGVVAPVPDTTAPTVAITAPSNGATVSGTVNVSVVANDDVGVFAVQLLVDNVTVGSEDTTAPYSFSLNTVSLTNGVHAITARARDAAGNTTTSAVVNITVSNAAPDLTAPTVSVTAPAANSTVSGTVNVTANASDNTGVVGVQFLLNGVALGAEDTTAPYSTSWNTTGLTNGNYILSARARDGAGNMTTSSGVTVTVSNVNPQATYTWISQNILVPKCLSCHGEAGASANVRYNTYQNTLATAQAGNLAGSKLYTETNNGSMPMGGPRLPANELKAIADWINAGALNN